MNTMLKPEFGRIFLPAVLFCLLLLSPVQAYDAAGAGRNIAARHRDSVITLQLVNTTRMIMEGVEFHRSEEKNEITATVIDPSGLAVFSLSSSDPAGLVQRLLSGGDEDMKIESVLTEITLRFSDGREIPGEVVIRDRDLDMAFARPAENLAEPVPALDLSQYAEADILEPVVLLSRMGRGGGWVPSIMLDRIKSVLSRPRTFYLPDQNTNAYGCPAFNMEGKVIGIVLLRITPGFSGDEGLGLGMMSGALGGDTGIFPVILPVRDILEVVEQIPARDSGN